MSTEQDILLVNTHALRLNTTVCVCVCVCVCVVVKCPLLSPCALDGRSRKHSSSSSSSSSF